VVRPSGARTVSWAVPWAGVHEGVVEESQSLSERPTPVPGEHDELHGPNSCDRSVECGPRRCRCGVNAPESRLGLETGDPWVRSRLLGARILPVFRISWRLNPISRAKSHAHFAACGVFGTWRPPRVQNLDGRPR
jgi:hypothetical protein